MKDHPIDKQSISYLFICILLILFLYATTQTISAEQITEKGLSLEEIKELQVRILCQVSDEDKILRYKANLFVPNKSTCEEIKEKFPQDFHKE